MKNLKTFLIAVAMLLTLNTTNLTASTSNITEICANPLNSTFKLIINDVEYRIATPINLLTTPVTLQIIDNGIVVFECKTQSAFRVVGDGIDHRVVGDGIDHLRTIEVSQGGVLLFERQL